MRIPIAISLAVLTLGSLAALAGDPSRPDRSHKPKAGEQAAGRAGGSAGRDRTSTHPTDRARPALALRARESPRACRPARAAQGDEARPVRAGDRRAVAGQPVAGEPQEERRAALSARARSLEGEVAGRAARGPGSSARRRRAREAVAGGRGDTSSPSRSGSSAWNARTRGRALKKLDETIERLEIERDALVESRYQGSVEEGSTCAPAGGGPVGPLPAGRRRERTEA